MISLNSITIRNFLSVGAVAQTVALADAPLTLLLGRNLDLGGENNHNGSGKTTLLQAISYALYGEPLTKIKMDNLVNSINEQALYVSIEFSRDGVPYRIERGRKPMLLRFLVGVEQHDFAQGENRQTQVEIDRILGMTHTMFLHIVALNTFTIPFLKMRPADQREVVEELMGITLISQLAEQLKLAMDASKEIRRDEEAKIVAIGEANRRIEQAIERARGAATGWTHQHTLRVDELSERATRMLDIDIDAELALFDRIDVWDQQHASCKAQSNTVSLQTNSLRVTIARLRADLARYESEAAREHTEASRVLRQQRLRLDVDAKRTAATQDNQHADILDQLARADVQQCSVCGQDLNGTDHLASVIAALVHQRDLISARIEQDAVELHANQQALDREIAMMEKHAAEQRSSATTQAARVCRQINQMETELTENYAQLERLATELANAGRQPVSLWASRDALFRVRQERDKLIAQFEMELAAQNPLLDRIEGLSSTLATIDYDRLNEANSQHKHETFLYKLLTSKDSFIRKRIIHQNLPYLNRCLNRYLDRLGLPHEVCFLPDLTVLITLAGRDLDFEQLSRGEMNRVILATSFAFRDMWESLNHAVNLTFVDECLDSGTDQAGFEAAVEVLADIALCGQKNIFIISHREELKSQIDRVLLASKENQFTTFSSST